MSLLVADCPRCGAEKMTFDVSANLYLGKRYGWQIWHELFCVCRHCSRSTTFVVSMKPSSPDIINKFSKSLGLVVEFDGALNQLFSIDRYIGLRDLVDRKPPEHLPEELVSAFQEGATCLSIGCYNAAATMFRLCIDLVTRPPLPDAADKAKPQPNAKVRRDLGLRLQWLFDNGILPGALRELAKCIREDANDGAHVGNLSKEDAEDVADFATSILERLCTEPKRLELAELRRVERRTPKA
jgi:Domain of unknown function (DUF4145)